MFGVSNSFIDSPKKRKDRIRMKVKQPINMKLSLYLPIDQQISFDFSTIKELIIKNIEKYFLEGVAVTTDHQSIPSLDLHIYLITDIFEVAKRYLSELNGLDEFYQFDLFWLKDSHDLSWGGMRLIVEEVHAEGETKEGDFCLSEGFEVEGVEIHEIDEHAAS